MSRPASPGRDCPRCPRLVAFREQWRDARAGTGTTRRCLVRSARCAPPDRRPGAGPARRQPHRPAVHRRLGRRSALRDACTNTASRAANTKSGPTTGSSWSIAASPTRVRCVPPENKPTPAEINTCRDFLMPTIAEMPKLRAIVTLGRISHETTVKALGGKRSAAPFGHGAPAAIGALTIFSQLSLLALQHQYRRADAEDVQEGVRQRARLSRQH